MYTVEIRRECYTAFLSGKSLKTIAVEKRIGLRTIESWSIQEGWVNKRAEVWEQTRKQISENHTLGLVQNDLIISEALYKLLRQAIDELQLYYNGKIPKKAMRFKLKDLVAFANAFAVGSAADSRSSFYTSLKKRLPAE